MVKQIIINRILIGGLLVAGIIFLFLGNYYYVLSGALHIVSACLLLYAVKKIKINENYSTLILIFLCLSFSGRIYFYNNFMYYDKILHLVIPFFITIMVWSYAKQFKLEYPKISVFLCVLGMLAAFELGEYAVDYFFNIDMIGVYDITGKVLWDRLTDTMWDLIVGTIGIVSYLIFKK